MALVISNERRVVMGNLKVLTGKVALSDTASFFKTGFDIVHHCSVQSEGTIGGNSEVQVILNSNDGSVDSNDGDVWIDSAWAGNGSFMAVGE